MAYYYYDYDRYKFVVDRNRLSVSNCDESKFGQINQAMISSAIGEIDEDLVEVIVSKGIDSIEEETFYNNPWVREIVVTEGVKSIGESAFARCINLEKVILPSTLEKIEKYLFAYSSIKSVELPTGLKGISNLAFYNCKNIQEIEIPNTVTTLGVSIFSSCTNLMKIGIPKHLIEKYGEKELRGCHFDTSAKIIPYGGSTTKQETSYTLGLKTQNSKPEQKALKNSSVKSYNGVIRKNLLQKRK